MSHMPSGAGQRGAPALGAVAGRLVLLVVVVAGTGVLLGTLFLPTALAAADIAQTVREDVLDVGPLADAQPVAQNSYIYAADGTQLAEINFQENRDPVSLDDIPDVMVNAVISTEDSTFREHNGLNYRAMIRAAIINLQAGSVQQGGSTITQQYVERAYLGKATTFERKITEAIWAIELEQQLSKDEILGRYLNHVYLGAGVYGVGTAAQRYFGKPVSELELPEAATLAGMIRAPETNNPLNNPAQAQGRRDIVLTQMTREGYITQEQAEAAKAIDMTSLLDPREPPPPDDPFWVSWITELLTDEAKAQAFGFQLDAFNAMGETVDERISTVFQGGLRIHTTLDPELQDLGEQAIQKHLTYDDEPAEEVAQEPWGGIVSVEPGSGAIRTAAFGPREFGSCQEGSSKFVGAADGGRLLCDKTKVFPLVPGMGTDEGRQPGSSFKPFVITAALENGFPPGWTTDATGPQQVEGCERQNEEPYIVQNTGGDGVHDMYSGIKASSNVFHVKLTSEVGPSNVADAARRLGITSVDPAEWGPVSCSIGLGTPDVYPLEMAVAYAAFANRGEHCDPFAISHIEGPNGDLVYRHSPQCEQVIDVEIADRVVDIMQGPVTPGGTAPSANLGQWPTRGKTGTTQDYRDAWFVGYVKQLATAAWIGYPNGGSVYESMDAARASCGDQAADAGGLPACPAQTTYLQDATIAGRDYPRVFGSTITAPMWTTYMSQAVERFEPASFQDPGPLPRSTVPDLLAAESLEEAEAIAEQARFTLVVEEVVDYREAGTFIEQDPAAGTQAITGSAITLLVSDGTGDVPEVPGVVGLERGDAVEMLEEAGYSVEVVETVTNVKKDDGVVVAQSPSGGAAASPDDTTVTIEVGRFEKAEPSPSPSPDGGGNGGGGGGGGGGNGGDGSGGGGAPAPSPSPTADPDAD